MNKIFTLFLFTFLLSNAKAQMAIAPSTTTPNASAMLDVQSTNRGMLIPRMTSVQRTSITTPANGLLVFDMDSSSIMMNTTTGWTKLQSTTDLLWKKNGYGSFYAGSGNVGLGTQTPFSKLDIQTNIGGGFGSSVSIINTNGTGANSGATGALDIKSTRPLISGFTMPQAYGIDVYGVDIGIKAKAKVGTAIFAQGDSIASALELSAPNGKALLVNSGNVGLGTQNPLSKLEVETNIGGNSGTSVRITNTNGTGANTGVTGALDIKSTRPLISGFAMPQAYGIDVYGVDIGIKAKAKVGTAILAQGDSIASALELYAPNGKALLVNEGNVGIGVTNPIQKIEVAGAIKIADATATPADGTIRYTTANGFQGMHNGSWQVFNGGGSGANQWNSNGNNISNSNTGNVGIGTVNPTQKFEVAGAIKIADIGSGFNPVNGTIAYTGSDFLGYNNGWKSLTAGNYKAGSGITFSADTIKTIPQTLSLSGNNLSLSNGGGTVTLPSAGSSVFSVSGNDINNTNTGKVLIGDPPFNSSFNAPRFQFRDNTNGTGNTKYVASIVNAQASYTTVLNVVDSGTSGNPMGSINSVGNAAVRSFSKYGDALFANSSNGRGIYLKGGNGSFYPAMEIDTNNNAVALKVNGQIQLAGGSAGKVLTSDANGIASWQTPSGGSGSSYTAGTGININGSNQISINLQQGSGISISGNTISATGSANAAGWQLSGSNISLVNNSDNVGIGTASSSQVKLNVDGGAQNGIWANTSSATGSAIAASATGATGTAGRFDALNKSIGVNSISNDSTAGRFRSYNGVAGVFIADNNLAIQTTGKVAINKETATEDLEVNGAIVVGGNSVAATASNGTIRNSGFDLEGYVNGSWYSLTGSDLWTRASNSVRMYYPSYNFGIGTYADPVEKLEVNGAIKIGYANSINAGTMRFDGTNFEGYDGTNWKTFGSPLQTNSLTNYIPTSNNLGIGTDNAAAKLHIKSFGGSFFPSFLIEQAGLLSPSSMMFKNAGSTDYWAVDAYNSGTASTSSYTINNNGTSVLRMTADGNATLTGTLTQNSDKRLKKNIQPLNNVLNKLNKLNGYSYNWIDDKKEKGLQIGFLAQEVQEQFPQLVKQDDKGTLSVAYGNMVPVLLQAIKEQQAEIDALKQTVATNNSNKKAEQENAQLKQQLNELMKKFEVLEKMVTNKVTSTSTQTK